MQHILPIPHCRVLPPGRFNGIILELSPVYAQSFMTTSLTVSCSTAQLQNDLAIKQWKSLTTHSVIFTQIKSLFGDLTWLDFDIPLICTFVVNCTMLFLHHSFITSTKAEVMRSVQLVCQSFVLCHSVSRITAKVYRPISLKLGVMTAYQLVVIQFQAQIPDHFSTSPTTVEWGIVGDLLTFLIQSSAAFNDTGWNDWCQQGNESTTFCGRSGRHPNPKLD